ncbi:MAG: UvrD-helicase domain-containing protein [Gemmatimonadetes bacterium]|nr:UvrD-helicase domain-containing protein [Gemmatimonadota bacterium]
MTEPTVLRSLNPEQRQAVQHLEGPLLVLAGAGSGKTRVLTTRIAQLIAEHGVDPAAVLAVTFTNKAAGEMRERVRLLLGSEPAGLWIGTFHAIGARLLRRHAARLGWTPNFTIYDAEQAVRVVKRALERLNLPLKRWHPQAVHAGISGAKNQLVGPAAFASTALDAFSRVVADVYPLYDAALREQNAFDFDDLLMRPVELFLDHADVLDAYRRRFRFLLVDEYQDTNHAQYRFLELLAREHGNLMVVGDDDQSIYRWRGADIRNILDFEKDFPDARVVRLEQNYRSTRRILDAANRVIAENMRRKGKTLRTDAGAGEPLTRVEALDERDEADWIAAEIEQRLAEQPERTPREFVVLYRTNAQSRALEEAFRTRDLPYQIVGGTRFYERREIMDVLAYLRLISNARDAGAFDRIVNYPRRGLGDVSRDRLLAWAAERALSPLDAAARAAEVPGLGPAAVNAFVALAQLLQRYRALAPRLPVAELLGKLVEEIGLLDALRDEGPEGEDRIENVGELVAGAAEFDARRESEAEDEDSPDATPLDLFLQKVALLTDVDRHDPEARAVTLMTLHNAKGLEFPFVFISGLEDGLFPLARAYDEPEELEEERRLFYVGITRAREKVYLTHARMRRRAGELLACIPSSFLRPIPPELLDERTTPGLARLRDQDERRWAFRRVRRRRGEPAGAGFGDGDGGDGVAIDYSDSQDSPRFIKGERVRHPQFGSGTIRELTGFGPELKAVIDFEQVGRKKVIVRYANLQREY